MRMPGAILNAYNCAGTLASIARQRPALVLLDDHIATRNAAGLDAYIAQRYRASISIAPTTTNAAVATVLNVREKRACLEDPFALDALTAYVTQYIPSIDPAPPN